MGELFTHSFYARKCASRSCSLGRWWEKGPKMSTTTHSIGAPTCPHTAVERGNTGSASFWACRSHTPGESLASRNGIRAEEAAWRFRSGPIPLSHGPAGELWNTDGEAPTAAGCRAGSQDSDSADTGALSGW